MKERLMQGNLFKCKSFPPHEPLSHARSSPTVRIRIRSIVRTHHSEDLGLFRGWKQNNLASVIHYSLGVSSN